MKEHNYFVTALIAMVAMMSIGYVAYDKMPKGSVAQVIEIHWLTTTNVYEKVRKHHDKWYSAPAKAYNIKCEQKQQGSDYCFCPPDRDYKLCQKCPVFAAYCNYDIDEWVLLESINTDGTDYTPVWPDVITIGSNQKTTSEISFEVLLRTGLNEIEIYRPDNIVDYEKFIVGDVWKIKPHASSSVRPLKILETFKENK